MNEQSPPKKLTRSRDNRYIGGVAAGIARYLDIDPIFVRIAFLISLVLGGLSLLAYGVLLAVMPIEGDPGRPVTPIEPRRRNMMIGGAVVVGLLALFTADDGSFAAWIFGFARGTVFGVIFWVAAAAGLAWLVGSGMLGKDRETGPAAQATGEAAEPEAAPAPAPEADPDAEAPIGPVTYAESPTQLSPTEVMATRRMDLTPGDGDRDPGHDSPSGPIARGAPSMIGRITLWFAIGISALILVGVLFVVSAGVTAVLGGVPMAAAVILLGGGMVFAGLRGRRRLSLWLLAAAVAVTVPMAAVSIADLGVEGSYGDIKENPLTLADVPSDGYRMAAGSMRVDLRRFDFDGRRPLDLPVRSGMGLTSIIVPDDVCVTGQVDGKAGVASIRGRQTNGLDITQAAPAPALPGADSRFANPVMRLDGEFKLGAFEVVDGTEWRAVGRGGSFEEEDSSRSVRARKRASAACAITARDGSGSSGKRVVR